MISKQLVELMGGKIWFKSQEGVGSEFYFTLPVEIVEKNIFNQDTIQYLHEKSFLVVDDNSIDRKYMISILHDWNVKKIEEASNAKEAYNILKNQTFDYTLLDWKMPDMDGITLIEKLQKENINLSNILMVTAHEKKQLLDLMYSKNIKFQDILEKPFTSYFLGLLLNKYKNNNIEKSTNNVKIVNSNKIALLVEDNNINQIVAKKSLEKFGLEVVIANNGLEAVNMCKDNSYDIVFMDLQMPVMDGFEATKRIREFDLKTPIIALSAAVMQKDKELTYEAGMDEHIAKPINKEELNLVIEKYIINNTKR